MLPSNGSSAGIRWLAWPSAVALIGGALLLFRGDGPSWWPRKDGLPLQRLDGGSTNLSDYRGKPVLLSVWATWCWSCREELPALARLSRQWKRPPMAVVAISVDRDGAEVVEPLIAELGVRDLTIRLDPSGASVRAFGVTGLPTTILLGSDGLERRRWVGPQGWDREPMLSELAALVASEPSGRRP